ncbi:MAG TPA: hypothetical protein VND93_21055 [Myxococcales bacterium]|nr:hypothetical protein [Myxococcales bacterium]
MSLDFTIDKHAFSPSSRTGQAGQKVKFTNGSNRNGDTTVTIDTGNFFSKTSGGSAVSAGSTISVGSNGKVIWIVSGATGKGSFSAAKQESKEKDTINGDITISTQDP